MKEFNPEDMPIIEIDMSKVRQYKVMDELTEQAEILGMYEDREILTCKTPPEGWYCTRGEGHRGPCAAYPDGFDDTNIDLLFTCGTFDTNDCISVEQLTKLMKDGETK